MVGNWSGSKCHYNRIFLCLQILQIELLRAFTLEHNFKYLSSYPWNQIEKKCKYHPDHCSAVYTHPANSTYSTISQVSKISYFGFGDQGTHDNILYQLYKSYNCKILPTMSPNASLKYTLTPRYKMQDIVTQSMNCTFTVHSNDAIYNMDKVNQVKKAIYDEDT